MDFVLSEESMVIACDSRTRTRHAFCKRAMGFCKAVCERDESIGFPELVNGSWILCRQRWLRTAGPRQHAFSYHCQADSILGGVKVYAITSNNESGNLGQE